MGTQRIAWHPGFASAVRLEFDYYKNALIFDTEHELNKQPLRIDVLVIKKDPDVHLESDIGALFRGHNIMEFKSEQDGLTIDDLFKTIGYGCLYKAYGPGVDGIRPDDVTLTLVRRRKPKRLFQVLESYGSLVESSALGVYRIGGLQFPTQVIVTSELNPGDHIWFASLASDLETSQLKELANTVAALSDKDERELADSVFEVVARANSDGVARLKEDDEMSRTLYEIMKPEIDEAIAKARLEAATEAATEAAAYAMEKGMEKGMERGMEKGLLEGRMEAVRATVERLLGRGGFSDEEIAEIAGTTVDEVRGVAAGLRVALA